LTRITHTVPIVFVQMTDPVGAGAVESLARPGGNATGFRNAEYGMSAKWLELLKEIAPRVRRAAVLRETNATGIGQLAAIQSFGLPWHASTLTHCGGACSIYSRKSFDPELVEEFRH
jgi:hypothetical protein